MDFGQTTGESAVLVDHRRGVSGPVNGNAREGVSRWSCGSSDARGARRRPIQQYGMSSSADDLHLAGRVDGHGSDLESGYPRFRMYRGSASSLPPADGPMQHRHQRLGRRPRSESPDLRGGADHDDASRQWTGRMEDMMNMFLGRVERDQWIYKSMVRKAKWWDSALLIISAVISGLVGVGGVFGVVSDVDPPLWLKIASTTLSFVAGIILVMSNTWKPSEVAASAQTTWVKLLAIRHRVDLVLAIAPRNRPLGEEFVLEIAGEFESACLSAPVPYSDIVNRARRRFPGVGDAEPRHLRPSLDDMRPHDSGPHDSGPHDSGPHDSGPRLLGHYGSRQYGRGQYGHDGPTYDSTEPGDMRRAGLQYQGRLPRDHTTARAAAEPTHGAVSAAGIPLESICNIAAAPPAAADTPGDGRSHPERSPSEHSPSERSPGTSSMWARLVHSEQQRRVIEIVRRDRVSDYTRRLRSDCGVTGNSRRTHRAPGTLDDDIVRQAIMDIDVAQAARPRRRSSDLPAGDDPAGSRGSPSPPPSPTPIMLSSSPPRPMTSRVVQYLHGTAPAAPHSSPADSASSINCLQRRTVAAESSV
jgi:hypothetical protein